MSNQSNFAGGFFLGAVVGGILGGILGATLVSRRFSDGDPDSKALGESKRDDQRDRDKSRKRVLAGANQPDFEMTRRGLEDKIAQLNEAIDEARQQIGNTRVESPDFVRQDTPDLKYSSQLTEES